MTTPNSPITSCSESSPEHVSMMLRASLIIGPSVTALGIAWVAMSGSEFAGVVLLIGLFTSIGAIHRYGRCGPDKPIQFKD